MSLREGGWVGGGGGGGREREEGGGEGRELVRSFRLGEDQHRWRSAPARLNLLRTVRARRERGRWK